MRIAKTDYKPWPGPISAHEVAMETQRFLHDAKDWQLSKHCKLRRSLGRCDSSTGSLDPAPWSCLGFGHDRLWFCNFFRAGEHTNKHACMPVCMHVYTCILLQRYQYVCRYICMYVHARTHVNAHITHVNSMSAWLCTWMQTFRKETHCAGS